MRKHRVMQCPKPCELGRDSCRHIGEHEETFVCKIYCCSAHGTCIPVNDEKNIFARLGDWSYKNGIHIYFSCHRIFKLLISLGVVFTIGWIIFIILSMAGKIR
jgi:hypothetical protein